MMTDWKNNGRIKLLIIVGTRPEIIRLAAVIKKCRKYFDQPERPVDHIEPTLILKQPAALPYNILKSTVYFMPCYGLCIRRIADPV